MAQVQQIYARLFIHIGAGERQWLEKGRRQGKAGARERNKREGSDCERTRDAEAGTAWERESLSSLGKAASHRQQSYGEEGPDDRRSASKGEKERVSYRLLLYISNRFNCGHTFLP